jgi:hypothetical protein
VQLTIREGPHIETVCDVDVLFARLRRLISHYQIRRLREGGLVRVHYLAGDDDGLLSGT